MGGFPSGPGGSQNIPAGMPDMSMFAKMMQSLNENLTENQAHDINSEMPKVDDAKITEAQKLFEEVIKDMNSKEEGGENEEGLSNMFKNFDKIAKEA